MLAVGHIAKADNVAEVRRVNAMTTEIVKKVSDSMRILLAMDRIENGVNILYIRSEDPVTEAMIDTVAAIIADVQKKEDAAITWEFGVLPKDLDTLQEEPKEGERER
jgi:MoxR-like ATPase